MAHNNTALHGISPVIESCLFYKQNNCLFQINFLGNILKTFKNHLKCYFRILTAISGADYPENYYRFGVLYELLTVKYNSRLRKKVIGDEISSLNTTEKVFMGANWWENEVWDMLGGFFFNKENITRLLTDYGFQGYPLRKDFPLSGFNESKFSVIKNRIVYENLELAQEYRLFDALSPWEELLRHTLLKSL